MTRCCPKCQTPYLVVCLKTTRFPPTPVSLPLVDKTLLAKSTDERRDYYRSTNYVTKWRKCCFVTLREVLSIGTNAKSKIRRQKPDLHLVYLPEVPLVQVYVYFLGFLSLKVSFLLLFFYFFIIPYIFIYSIIHL